VAAARPADDRPAPEAVAAALAAAPFVRVLARADGDSLAAAGLLARALRDHGTPFQVRTAPNPTPVDAPDDEHTVAVGVAVPAADSNLIGRDAGEPASVQAFAVARELGVEPDPVLGLAGVVAAGEHPGAAGSDGLLSAAEEREALVQRPGVAVPTVDLGDGLAHSTLLHAPFSGDLEGARATLAELDLPADLDEDAHRRVASLVAVDVVADDATSRASEAVERALRPHVTPEAPFETVGGYADVLSAVAREAPGTGVALAMGHGADGETRTDALDAWREHALLVHTELRDATTGRYDGLFVARLDASADVGRLATAARLLRDFRSPEPVALVVADGAAAAASVAAEGVESPHLGDVAASAADALAADGDAGATGYGTRGVGEATFDAETSAFIAAFREGLQE
jgi:hypothetical protein